MRSEVYPVTRTSPLVGRSAMWLSRIVVDFPDPECPVRNTNSPFFTCSETSRSTNPPFAYSLDTFVSLITGSWRLGGSRRKRHSGTKG